MLRVLQFLLEGVCRESPRLALKVISLGHRKGHDEKSGPEKGIPKRRRVHGLDPGRKAIEAKVSLIGLVRRQVANVHDPLNPSVQWRYVLRKDDFPFVVAGGSEKEVQVLWCA
jgi:hypothetical protein